MRSLRARSGRRSGRRSIADRLSLRRERSAGVDDGGGVDPLHAGLLSRLARRLRRGVAPVSSAWNWACASAPCPRASRRGRGCSSPWRIVPNCWCWTSHRRDSIRWCGATSSARSSAPSPTRGGTVLFSSHLLDEMERVVDHVAMIDKGRIVLSAAMDEIQASHRRLTLRFERSAFATAGAGRRRWPGREPDTSGRPSVTARPRRCGRRCPLAVRGSSRNTASDWMRSSSRAWAGPPRRLNRSEIMSPPLAFGLADLDAASPRLEPVRRLLVAHADPGQYLAGRVPSLPGFSCSCSCGLASPSSAIWWRSCRLVWMRGWKSASPASPLDCGRCRCERGRWSAGRCCGERRCWLWPG